MARVTGLVAPDTRSPLTPGSAYVTSSSTEWEREHLLFRDYLRDAMRDDYAELKQQLAIRFPDDRLAYTEGKSEFIVTVMKAAKEELQER